MGGCMNVYLYICVLMWQYCGNVNTITNMFTSIPVTSTYDCKQYPGYYSFRDIFYTSFLYTNFQICIIVSPDEGLTFAHKPGFNQSP